MTELATNLRNIRGHQGLGVRELARKAGIQSSTVVRIEQGKGVNLDAVVKVAKALGVSLDTLVTKARTRPDQDRPILCLDFDGVLHAYTSGWHGEGTASDGPVEGAMRFVVDATPEFRIAIYSTRSTSYEGRTAMQTFMRYWLNETGARWHVFDLLEWPETKPAAMVTIDDRAITFTGTFPEVKELLAFTPWNTGGNLCKPTISPGQPSIEGEGTE